MKPGIQLTDKTKGKYPIDSQQIKKRVAGFLRPFGLGKLEVSIHLISEQEIKRINRSYRNKDQSTDVISFPIDEPLKKSGGRSYKSEFVILGDIFLSPEVIERETSSNKLTEKIVEVIKHGLTHLLGFNHGTDKDKKEFNRVINQEWLGEN